MHPRETFRKGGEDRPPILLLPFTPQFILSGNTLTDMPKMCLLDDAQTHLADTQVKLSHQVYVVSCL